MKDKMLEATNELITEPRSSNLSWFASDACVERLPDETRIFVGGYIVAQFDAKDTVSRNLLLVGLGQEKRFKKINIASSLGLTDERVLQIRRAYEAGGVEALLPKPRSGRPPRMSSELRGQIFDKFAAGESPKAVFDTLGPAANVSLRTIERMRVSWLNGAGQPHAETSLPAPVVLVPAQQELPLSGSSKTDSHAQAESIIEDRPVPVGESETQSESDAPDNNVIPEAPVQSARHVLNAGCLLLIASVFSLGLHASVLSGWNTTQRNRSRLREILDALISALGIGQRCVEGVRRLEHPTGTALLRAENVPSESGTRLLVKEYLKDVGGCDALLKMMSFYLQRGRLEEDAPAVFYVDNHMRPYTGKLKLQKGWRMQDKRVRPGTCDYYVHDEDGRPLFRVDVPMHNSLGDWLRPIAALLRENLGPNQRILLAFDRGGAFPAHLLPLCENGIEFVTYERAPYQLMAKELFVETVELEDETLLAFEEQALLGDKGEQVRRIALRTQDERQVNVIAASSLPMSRLVEIITGRWVQENGFKHENERWGGNQLDCRKAVKYDPHHIIVNPARKRLEQALLISRDREGTVRRHLARAKGQKRDALKAELNELLAQQKNLETERKTTPRYSYLKDTELSDKLVYIDTHYKAFLDTIRIACINAESDLADLLKPHLPKPREAKMVLQNIFKSPGHIRVHDDRIDLTLSMVGNHNEKLAAQAFASALNNLNLSLPGDPMNRPLKCRFQI
jgi:hypothetical protein